MRRDLALQDLSRDHHAILLLAQHLRRAPQAPDDALRRLRDHVPLLLLHFQEEESLVFPNLPAEEADRLTADHQGFRNTFRDLGLQGTLPVSRLAEMGVKVQAHIREEESAFDRLQRDLGAGQMAALGEALLKFRRRHRPEGIGPEACDFPAGTV